MNIRAEINKTLMLAYRDVLKLLRDRPRLFISLVFPVMFMVVFGITLDSSLSGLAGSSFDALPNGFFLNYVFSGILAQSIFQTSFAGIVSLVSDREEDFSMSIFVAPISRLSIVLGKIIGESLVAFIQVFGIIIFGYILGITISLERVFLVLPFGILFAVTGGCLGLLVASRIEGKENAQRTFPLLILPLTFLSGAFTPVNDLPLILNIIKSLNPMYYAVDLSRSIIFANEAGIVRDFTINNSFGYNLLVLIVLGLSFLLIGTFLFTRKEGNR
ncbi:ABC transporter permease [Candidatus Dojkabacteria bacterium]|uniref:Transport permease protein n=1 Tax=Candidatus Dojkabacteria bacterium TaxID=2099670 RepID=A0A955RLM3_9BACT|nr:ABC transporter permease [Candidatus Dojkabacteria bacterium]